MNYYRRKLLVLLQFQLFTAALLTAVAGPPPMIAYQGRVTANGTALTETGQFRALVNADGTQSFWSHDGSSSGGSEPSSAVSLAVTNGLYSVRLGDTAIAGMTSPLPPVSLLPTATSGCGSGSATA